MRFMCALIVVEDIEKSRYFYETVLNQNVKNDFGENIIFHGDFSIHQKKHFQDLIKSSPISSRSNNFELYFEDDDLEGIMDNLKNNKVTFIHEIIEQPWKQRVIRFYDLDYNIIEIGERMEHVAFRLSKENMSIEDISRTTYLPEESVEQAISVELAIQEYNKLIKY